jgi:hypothetical protein
MESLNLAFIVPRPGGEEQHTYKKDKLEEDKLARKR